MLTAEDVLLELEGSDGEVSSGEESDCEGKGIVGYLSEPASYFLDAFQGGCGVNSDASDVEDDTAMDWEDGRLERISENIYGRCRYCSSRNKLVKW